MGKKGKKGGKKGKGKKGGKKSGTKKSAKDASIKSMSDANSKMWESRLGISETAKVEYRETARKLLHENDTLSTRMHQTEKDTVEIINHMKQKDAQKDTQMDKVIYQMKEMKQLNRLESERLVGEFQDRTKHLEERLAQKTHEVEVLQTKLRLVKEFSRKRDTMQAELDQIKESLMDSNREHKSTIVKMEQKFFEEKIRLQKEANLKISELADRAHSEAIANLDETTRSVYKENVKLNQALVYHTKEEHRLKAIKEKLENDNGILSSEKEMNDLVIKKKVAQFKQDKTLIKELQEKVDVLEQSLSHVVHEFDSESKKQHQLHLEANDNSHGELQRLQRVVELKSREMNKVKKLAKNILDQRTDIERFFLDSLNHVKEQITVNRRQYRHDARIAYQHRMLDAYVGKCSYPKVRTFADDASKSTNSVFQDLNAAEKMLNISERVDVADLTWEQRETVLRYLFAKMNNGNKLNVQKPKADPVVEIPAIDNGEQIASDTFVTQNHLAADLNNFPVLPSVGVN